MSFNSDYEEIMLLLLLIEQNTAQDIRMIKIALERMKRTYEGRIQEVGDDNNREEQW
jgi:hypothetical protein